MLPRMLRPSRRVALLTPRTSTSMPVLHTAHRVHLHPTALASERDSAVQPFRQRLAASVADARAQASVPCRFPALILGSSALCASAAHARRIKPASSRPLPPRPRCHARP